MGSGEVAIVALSTMISLKVTFSDGLGGVKHSVDFDKLRQLLSSDIVEGNEERYQFTWPDKRNASPPFPQKGTGKKSGHEQERKRLIRHLE